VFRVEGAGVLTRGKKPVRMDTKPSVSTTRTESREGGAVKRWRREQLVNAGFPLPLAVAVASDSLYDLHALIELVERGCPPELAARILAPLERGISA
jgi:hypothetical protein